MRNSLFIYLVLLFFSFKLEGQTMMIDRAISKDDHKNKIPLQEALNVNFAGVSVKVKIGKDGLIKCDGKLFEDLYLKPLQKRASENNGWIYPGRPDEFFVIVEVNGDSLIAFKAFEKLFDSYSGILSSFIDGKRNKKAVKLVLTGDIPRSKFLETQNKYCTIDEPIQKIDSRYDGNSISISTLNFKKLFNWDGTQNMPNMQYHSFISYLKNSRKAGHLSFVTNIPQNPNAWGIMLEAGADFLEVDDFEAFIVFWRNRKAY
jgi:hypothetical protein